MNSINNNKKKMGLVNANLIPELINLSNKFITTPCTSITFSSVRWHDHMCITIASAAAQQGLLYPKKINANFMPTNRQPLNNNLIGFYTR